MNKEKIHNKISILGAFIFFFEIIPVITKPISTDFPPLQKLLGISYPVLNLIVLFLIGDLLIKLKGGKFQVVLLLILLGFILITIGDVWYAYLDLNGIYTSYHPVDLSWKVGYLLIGLGGFYQSYLLKHS
jgi:hypothetical protein